jgi:hypothetical protein
LKDFVLLLFFHEIDYLQQILIHYCLVFVGKTLLLTSTFVVFQAGLPEARNHVVTKHGMRHMRKLKMQWLGDPASVDKSVAYKDKSSIWFQKLKVLIWNFYW